MAKIDMSTVPLRTGSVYPGRLDALMKGRSSLRLGDVGGLSQFGVNLVFIEPGGASSLRHYHMQQDEFAMVTEGELVLVEEGSETVMGPGDCAAWPAGVENGHCLENRGDARAAFLVIGSRTPTETAYYSDLDMMVTSDSEGFTFTRKNGSPLTADQIGDEND